MDTTYEYRFVRLGDYRGSAWFGVSDKARGAHEDAVHEHAREGWRLVQIFAPGVAAFGAAKYYELIFERERAEHATGSIGASRDRSVVQQGHEAAAGRSSDHRDREGLWWDACRSERRPSSTNQGSEEIAMATLQIELEDMAGASWWAGALATLASQAGNAYLRFVGLVDGHRQYKGATFPAPRTLGELPPQEAWAPGMTKSLQDLRREIENDGWLEAGRGTEPWAIKYERSASG